MNTNISIFGQLTDIIGSNNLEIPFVEDTNELQKVIIYRYPSFANTTYLIAVNKIVVSENTKLTDKSMVAILPPFSGG